MSKKGLFGKIDLPVATDYIVPRSRRWLWLPAGFVAVALLAIFAFDLRFRQGELFSSGPLSRSHAVFARDCSACHQPFAAAGDATCAGCHEQFGSPLASFSFGRHVLYHSDDFSRLQARAEAEPSCIVCHIEHQGAGSRLSDVPDHRCQACHSINAFNRDHPGFNLARNRPRDPAGLKFSHLLHLERLQRELQLTEVEQACFYCHVPDRDGRRFQAIAFERACARCHLTGREATPQLSRKVATAPGVLLPAELAAQKIPDLILDPPRDRGNFRLSGNTVQMLDVRHRDAWILANLRLLRRELYPSLGLADLLPTTGEVVDGSQTPHAEAILRLRAQADGLRGLDNPRLQAELRQIDDILLRAEALLANPFTPRNDAAFRIVPGSENPDLPRERIQQYQEVIQALTQPCRTCHEVENASIVRVQPEWQRLRRATFSHRPHTLQRRCLDCHAGFVPSSDSLAMDRNAVQDFPAIDSCRECHQAGAAPQRCVTCHEFHPDKSYRPGWPGQ